MLLKDHTFEKPTFPIAKLLVKPCVIVMLLLSLSSCSTQTAPKHGTWHTLAPGETLDVLSRRYSVPISDIKAANDIYDPDDLAPGNQLYIPTPARIKTEPAKPKIQDPLKFASKPKPIPKQKQPKIKFIWPSKGTISSGFGLRHGRMHEGIDITKDRGRDVKAAATGIVEFAGNRNGYGKTIIINHGNGYKTLYAHNQKLYVRKGVRVRTGALIARMGSSGRSSGIHLHFEVQYKGKPKNPLRFLPVR